MSATTFDDGTSRYDTGLRLDAGRSQQRNNHMATPSLNLSRLVDLETLQLTQDIITKVTGNPHFGTPNPTLTALQALLTTATDAVNAYDATRQSLTMLRTDREDAMEALKEGLRALAGYVASASNGDATIILSSGMNVRQDPAPIGLPAAPQNLSAQFGANDGTSVLDWESVRGGRSYLVECATNALGPWTQVALTTDTQTLVTNLISGTKYYYRVRALGAAGLGPWSDLATKMAL